MSFRLLAVVCPPEKWGRDLSGVWVVTEAGAAQARASREAGALQRGATRGVSRDLRGSPEGEPGGVQECLAGHCELQADSREPLGDLKLSFANGLRAWPQMFQMLRGHGRGSDAGNSLLRIGGVAISKCLWSLGAGPQHSPAHLPGTRAVGLGGSKRGWGSKRPPALCWVSQTNIYQKQAAEGRCQFPGQCCVCAAQTMPCFMRSRAPEPWREARSQAPAKSG